MNEVWALLARNLTSQADNIYNIRRLHLAGDWTEMPDSVKIALEDLAGEIDLLQKSAESSGTHVIV